MLFNLEVWLLGIVIYILRKFMSVDIDKLGVINGIEVVLLGFVLLIDVFGVGIGVVIFGFLLIVMSIVVVIMSLLFVLIGINVGYFLFKWKWIDKMVFLLGFLLIMIGFWKL